MPQKTHPRNSRAGQREATLLRETHGLFLRIAAALEDLLVPAQALWKRLARTEAYRRVDGLDHAEQEPVWRAAGVIQAMLYDDAQQMCAYLRREARRVDLAARRRTRWAARFGHEQTLPPGRPAATAIRPRSRDR